MAPPVAAVLALIVAPPAAARLASPGALERALQDGARASCHISAAIDPELRRAARAFVEAAGKKRAPLSVAALSFFAGIEASDPAPLAAIAIVDAPERADRAVGDLLPPSCRFTHAGVAAAVLGPRQAVVAVLTAARAVELAPLPGSVAPGALIKVAGHLLGKRQKPRLYVLHPGGRIEELALEEGRSGRIEGETRLRERGEHVVELLADGSGGPEVLALRRIFAGVPAPARPPAGGPRSGNRIAQVESRIAELRAAHGLPALQRDAALDGIAEGHSRAMAQSRTFAHVLAADGALRDRLRKAGYAYRSAGENIGLAGDAETAHELVARSPAHLANLLDAGARRLGLGAAAGTSPEGAPCVYLTEVLADPVVGFADPAAEVFRILSSERRRLGLAPLTRDPSLDRIAREEVRSISLGSRARDRYGEAARRALDREPDLVRATTDLVVAGAPEDAISSAALREPGWTRMGVGALYASSREYGAGRLWMVLLYGR